MFDIESLLFRLPVEIRCAIYTYFLPDRIHIRLEKDQLRFSACLGPESRFTDEYSGYGTTSLHVLNEDERNPRGAGYFNTVWMRRLQSSWGSHWRCEEHAHGRPSKYEFDLRALLHVCRSMYLEFTDLLARTENVCVTDLGTVEYLHRTFQSLPESVNGIPSRLLKLTQLTISLKLPLNFYESFDNVNMLDKSTSELTGNVRTWLQLSSPLKQLKNLTQLRIWLDHDDKSTWTVVNERTLLQPLIPLFDL